MNHIRRIGIDGGSTCTALNGCHSERSLAPSEARSQAESKDPYNLHSIRADARNFRIAIRFFDDHDAEILHDSTTMRRGVAFDNVEQSHHSQK